MKVRCLSDAWDRAGQIYTDAQQRRLDQREREARDVVQISNDNSTQIAATIGSDGIFRFQIDATDENTRKFVEILQRTFGPIKGVEATEVQPPASKEKP